MSSFLNFLMGKMEIKGKIHVDLNDKKEECIVEVEGNIPSVLVGISVLVNNLVESGMPEELIRGAIDIALKENKSKPTHKTKVIKVDSEEKAKDIEKLLNKIMED